MPVEPISAVITFCIGVVALVAIVSFAIILTNEGL